jgi:hypothetical protein
MPLTATAAAGILLLVLGVMGLAIAIARSRVLPKWTGIGLAVGIVVFGVMGVILADVVQPSARACWRPARCGSPTLPSGRPPRGLAAGGGRRAAREGQSVPAH